MAQVYPTLADEKTQQLPMTDIPAPVVVQPVIVTQPAVVTQPGPRPYPRDAFTYDFCDCCGDCGECCLAMCCPCISNMAPANAVGMNGTGCCILTAICPWIQPCVTCNIRGKMVKSNCCTNCLLTHFCLCCAMIQVAREAKVS